MLLVHQSSIYLMSVTKMVRDKLKNLTVEEFANTITHGFGLLLSVAGFVLLVVLAAFKDDGWYIASSVLYGLSLIVLYAASTFYHGATSPELKRKLQILDRCCIYVLIAGTYTPFTLVVLRSGIGQNLFVFVWLFAAIGILSTVFFGKKFPAVSVISYLVMGWISVITVEPLFTALGLIPILLIVAGGLAYTVGVIFFVWESLRHHHAIWHLFVMAGSLCHFLVIAIYVIPYTLKA